MQIELLEQLFIMELLYNSYKCKGNNTSMLSSCQKLSYYLYSSCTMKAFFVK